MKWLNRPAIALKEIEECKIHRGVEGQKDLQPMAPNDSIRCMLSRVKLKSHLHLTMTHNSD